MGPWQVGPRTNRKCQSRLHPCHHATSAEVPPESEPMIEFGVVNSFCLSRCSQKKSTIDSEDPVEQCLHMIISERQRRVALATGHLMQIYLPFIILLVKITSAVLEKMFDNSQSWSTNSAAHFIVLFTSSLHRPQRSSM